MTQKIIINTYKIWKYENPGILWYSNKLLRASSDLKQVLNILED